MVMAKVLILGSGASIHLLRWVTALSVDRDVVVFSLEEYSQEFLSESISNVVLSGGRKSVLPKALSCILAVRRVKRLVKMFSPDVVVAHYASSYGLLGRLIGVQPLITCAWGSDIFDFPTRNFLNRWILKGNLEKSSQLVASSQSLAGEIRKYTHKNPEIVPFGVDTEKFFPVDLVGRKSFVIGIAKRLESESGIDRALKLVAKLKRMAPCDVILKIAGEGSEFHELKRLSERLEIESSVEWCGWVSHDELCLFYQSCNLLVFPSRAESFGVSAIEAMACGKPVVTSDAPGFLETVVSGETGFVCDFGAGNGVDEMADVVRMYMEDPALALRHGKSARSRVCRDYSWDSCVVKMEQLISGAIA